MVQRTHKNNSSAEEIILNEIEGRIPDTSRYDKFSWQYHDLKVLPPEIGKITWLTELDLSNNYLETLPTEIGKLTKLRKLNLHNNNLKHLPTQLGKLTQLEELGVSQNNLEVLPTEICNLINLRYLFTHVNPLRELPSQIGKLVNLDELSLHTTRLTQIPSEIGMLGQLRTLIISNNNVEELPTEIGELSNLENLYIDSCKIKHLPKEIGNLSNLIFLSASNNQLTYLPLEIKRLEELSCLDLRGNPLPIPPEILEKIDEPEAILDYYFQIKKDVPKAEKEIGEHETLESSPSTIELKRSQTQATKVFISYGHDDKKFVQSLANKLEKLNIEAWWDFDALQGGQNWQKEIQHGIKLCDFFLVVMTPESVESEWVNKEITYANEYKKQIIPLLLRPCERPISIIEKHYIDLVRQPQKVALKQLLKVLEDRD